MLLSVTICVAKYSSVKKTADFLVMLGLLSASMNCDVSGFCHAVVNRILNYTENKLCSVYYVIGI